LKRLSLAAAIARGSAITHVLQKGEKKKMAK
jgi:hypothetical protein